MTDFQRWFAASTVLVLSIGLGAVGIGTIDRSTVLAANSGSKIGGRPPHGILGMMRPRVSTPSNESMPADANEQPLDSGPVQFLISTFAGGLPGPTAATATSYAAGEIAAVATDRFGNTYASSSLHCVFRLDSNGLLERVAGTCRPGFSGDGGNALDAQLNNPQGMAVDPAGNLYIADQVNQRIRMVSPNGTITTVAGTGTAGFSGDNGPATNAKLNYPTGLAVDSAGNLYIADQYNNRIREIGAANGAIATIAGVSALGYYGDGGPATAARLNYPQGVAVDPSGNVYIADTDNNRVRKILVAAGTIATVAGDGTPGFSGDNQAATNAELNYPTGVALDYSNNLYIADLQNSRVRKVTTAGLITTFAGSNTTTLGDNGPASSAYVKNPQSVAVDVGGNVYIADQNFRIRQVNTSGLITTVANTGVGPFSGDGGFASLAQFGGNWGIAGDSNGNLYVADPIDFRVRAVNQSGLIATFAGTGAGADSGDSGPATMAGVTPSVVAADSAGNIYLGDSAVVRKVALNGVITTVAGTGVAGFSGDGGAATAARLSSSILGLVVDSKGNLYISDTNNSCVRKVSKSDGNIATVAGIPNEIGFNGDGMQGTATQLGLPNGLAVDSGGNLYIADLENYRVRELAANGIISTIAGNGGPGNAGDGGPALSAQLNAPRAVALDTSGNLYIAGAGSTVRVVSPSTGYIDTVAGTGVSGYTGDGGPATAAELVNPVGLAVVSGNIYVSDNGAGAVRILTPAGTAPVLTVSATDGGIITQGQTGASYTLTVANAASAASTGSTVTVTDTLPAGLTLQTMSGAGWSCNSGNVCQSTGALTAGQSYPIDVVVNVAADAPPQLTSVITVAGGGGAPSASTVDSTFVGAGTNGVGTPVLQISSTHSGNFLVGETNATYTVTVGNQASAVSSFGQVTVSEVLPQSGLSFVSMSGGTGWSCDSTSCKRSDPLPGDGVYPPITVTVSVTATQPTQVINQVTVKGGGSGSATANDPTNIVSPVCNIGQNGSITVGDVQTIIGEALGTVQPLDDLNGDGTVNAVDVQIAIGAAMGLGCKT